MMQTKDIYSAKCFNDIHERCVRVVRYNSSVCIRGLEIEKVTKDNREKDQHRLNRKTQIGILHKKHKKY